MDSLDGVLACRLLNIANFPSEQKQLANATDSKMGYNIAKMDYNNRPKRSSLIKQVIYFQRAI